jgi:hypothetical protein
MSLAGYSREITPIGVHGKLIVYVTCQNSGDGSSSGLFQASDLPMHLQLGPGISPSIM